MASDGSAIALPADPNGPEDFNVTVEALELALAERREQLRGAQRLPTKQQVTLRLDQDVLARFQATGPGWQSQINAALRAAEV
ncbi:BrnA antitoxin family protein [Sphingomonas sp.]|uniref:BrnA antitoxin family protein n=1 Tax=Sphingomonas sp. TaxID=28214 RepID=UPI003AFF6BA4